MTFVLGATRRGTHAVSRSISSLGDLSSSSTSYGGNNPSASGDPMNVYRAWITSVKNAGGIATVLNNRPAAKYEAKIWVPLVNAHKWPLPATYSRDGNWGYYYAPTNVATIDVVKIASDKGKLPDLPWTDAIAESLKKIAVPAVLGAGAVYVVGRWLTGGGGSRR